MVDLSWSHGRLLQQLVEMGALKMRPQAASVFAVEVQHLQQDLEEIRELLKNSWWDPGPYQWLTIVDWLTMVDTSCIIFVGAYVCFKQYFED